MVHHEGLHPGKGKNFPLCQQGTIYNATKREQEIIVMLYMRQKQTNDRIPKTTSHTEASQIATHYYPFFTKTNLCHIEGESFDQPLKKGLPWRQTHIALKKKHMNSK